MPDVNSTIRVAAPLEAVYGAAKDIERLADYIDDLESVTVTERTEVAGGLETVSEWIGLLPEFRRKLRWTERDRWDDAAHECRFDLLEGDLDAYSGVWTFAADGDGTRVDLTITYEYQVPLIGPLIQKLVHRKMQGSADATLAGLQRCAEGA